MRNPFAWISLYLGLGITCASVLRIPFWVAWCVAAACCALCEALAHREETAVIRRMSSLVFMCAVFLAAPPA